MAHLPKRAWIDFNRLQRLKSESKFIIDSSPFTNDEDIPTNFVFIGRILPNSEPFNQTALQIEIELSTEYPAKPPLVRFLTQVYHPNVEENGVVCLDILRHTVAWRPSLHLDSVIEELITVIDHPNLNYPVNDSVANEYLYHKDIYDKKLLEIIQKNKLPRI